MSAARGKMAWPQVKYETVTLGGGQTQTGVSYPGGLDQVTPSLSTQIRNYGDVLRCSNLPV